MLIDIWYYLELFFNYKYLKMIRIKLVELFIIEVVVYC